MKFATLFSLALAGMAAAAPAPLEERAACSSYTVISTRGTGEIQGPSAGFRSMNSQLLAAVPGGKVYNTVYPAGVDQNSAQGTRDIINKITTTLSSNPTECFILQGYSQGAAATTTALGSLSGAAFDAVKAVVMLGNPKHRAGLDCNVDAAGGTTTKYVNGLSVLLGSVPSNWIAKTRDICAFGDGVCDTTHGVGINAQHLSYPLNPLTQSLGFEYMRRAVSA